MEVRTDTVEGEGLIWNVRVSERELGRRRQAGSVKEAV
jgi:hypothetical protein